MASPALTIDRLTEFTVQETPGLREETNVRDVFHRSLASLVDNRNGYANLTSTVTEAALDIASQLGSHELDRQSNVLILGTATSGVPYAPVLARIIDVSVTESPRLKPGYIIAKRNVTHPELSINTRLEPSVEEYVARKGYDAIKQDEIKRLQETYSALDAKPDAVVLFDETHRIGGTMLVGQKMVKAAFGDNTPIITLSRKGDLPWDYEGKAQLLLDKGADGAHFAISNVDSRTREAFNTVAEASIRFIQEAVRGEHPTLLELFPSIDFDLNGEKKKAALLSINEIIKANLRRQIEDFKAEQDMQLLVDVIEAELARRDGVLEENLALYGLAHHTRHGANH